MKSFFIENKDQVLYITMVAGDMAIQGARTWVATILTLSSKNIVASATAGFKYQIDNEKSLYAICLDNGLLPVPCQAI